MRQPAGGFHQFLGSGPARAFQEVEDLGGLAADAGSFGLGNLGLGAAFGRFLGWSGLVSRLGLGGRNVGATWRNASLLVRFRLLAACRGCVSAVSFWNQRGHLQCSLSI